MLDHIFIVQLDPFIVFTTQQCVVMARDFASFVKDDAAENEFATCQFKCFVNVDFAVKLGTIRGKALQMDKEIAGKAADDGPFRCWLCRIAFWTEWRRISRYDLVTRD